MVIFQKQNEDIYLITNFKVMYTSLKKQESLIKVQPTKILLLKIMVSWILPRSRFYLVVRNPFDRIRSFYKSKFVRADDNRLYMLKNNTGNWQASTEHFFPYLGLDTEMDPLDVSKKLAATAFDEMISILPKVFMKDGHMCLQAASCKMKFRFGFNISLPIKFERVFKIESHHDLKELSDMFDLDLSTKYNNTSAIEDHSVWSQNSIQIVKYIYKLDFKSFEYHENPRKS